MTDQDQMRERAQRFLVENRGPHHWPTIMAAFATQEVERARRNGWSQYVCNQCKASVPENIPCPFCALQAAEQRAEEAEKEVARIKALYLEWSDHRPNCSIFLGDLGECPCDCGYPEQP
jgi:hypothetical protein